MASGIDQCLQQTFRRLDNKFQSVLLKLCLFRTAEFNLQAAQFVLMDVDADQEENQREETVMLKTKFLLLHLKSRHLLEKHDQSIQNEDKDSGIDTLYSIHPLVYDFLQRILNSDQSQTVPAFQRDFEKAEERFVVYYKEIIDNIGDTKEKGPRELNRIMDDNRIHFLSFFDILSKINMPTETDRKKIYSKNRQLAYLLDLCMDDKSGRTKRLQLIKKWGEDAERDDDQLMSIFWEAEKILAFIEMNETKIHNNKQNINVTNLEHESNNDTEYAILGRYFYALARYFSNRGERQSALHSLEKATGWYEKTQTRSYSLDVDVADVYNSIGCHYFDLNNIITAKSYHNKALDLFPEVADSDQNPNVRVYLCNIGACLFNEGLQLERKTGKGIQKFQEALDMYTRAIELDRKSNLNEKETHMEKLVNRAMVLVHLGEFEKAKSDVWRAADIRRRILPSRHPKLTLGIAKKGEIMYRWALKIKDDIGMYSYFPLKKY